jgi:hypothetical protein
MTVKIFFLFALEALLILAKIRSPPGAETIRSIPTDNQIRAVTFLLPVANHRLFSNLPTLRLDLAAPKQQISFQLSHEHSQQTALQVLIKLAMPFAFICCMFGRFRFALCNDISDMPLIKCERDADVIRRLKWPLQYLNEMQMAGQYANRWRERIYPQYPDGCSLRNPSELSKV